MTTPFEQVFLWGEVEPDPPFPEALMNIIAYADLTAGSAIILATLILFTFVLASWEITSLYICTGSNKFIASPTKTVFSLLRCYALEFLRLLLSRDDALAILRERFTKWIMDSRPYRITSVIVKWYFPFNCPIAASCRLFATWVFGLTMYTSVLVPAARYLSGVVDSWNSDIHSFHCPGAISRYYLEDRLSRRALYESYYCLGERTGLNLRKDIIASDWQLLSRLLNDDGEIDHYHAIIAAVSVTSLVILTTVVFTVLPETTAFKRAMAVLLRQDPQSDGPRPLTQTESDLWDMINGYEGDLATRKAQLAKKDMLLAATTAELHASKQRQEEGWALVRKLTAHRNEAVDAQQRELSNNRRLRRQILKIGGQLRAAEGCLQGNCQEHAKKCQQVVNERKQLAEERQQLASKRQESSEDQHLAEDRDRRQQLDEERQQLVEAQKQLIQKRKRLASPHQKSSNEQCLAKERQFLDEMRDRLNAQCQKLTEEQDQQLAVRCSELSTSLEETRQERDAALDSIIKQQHEIALINLSANISRAEAEIYYTQSEENQAHFHQSMSDLKSACDLAVEQERSATEEARKIACGLEMEVKNCHNKIDIAQRDAQRHYDQTLANQRTIEILEHRLARYRAFEIGSTQEVPKRQIGNPGSMSTALAEKDVTIANQLAQINDLTRQLEKVKQGAPCPAMPDESVQENLKKLRVALDKERRERTEDNIRWGSKTCELEKANQKLRISMSNAESKSRRLAGRRPPTVS
ncbi:uncharacterized protein EURHEDRAFT_455981 [Aspergillus ruber CBS 135680]|uniref:Integral membrane protein n=1 Tax=Aspergillus ruber (strain CBS 135680) TaxID=1388766 RepID=A0A017SDY8_ASPRC|nr:uncharacterized protein EURHEDRAFT_455981 [Aspergillus ruber CBS 135680]EYE95228.1 hypothetical protein EURHEDRAFT_455981 [Aspergillus ruber CBS 135680]